MGLYIRETFVNETRGGIFGESDWHDSDCETLGELYKQLRSEYGRCESKQYSDRVNAPPVQSGWVFRKRMEYEDYRPGRGERYYIREVWVSVSSTPPQQRMVNITRPWEKAS